MSFSITFVNECKQASKVVIFFIDSRWYLIAIPLPNDEIPEPTAVAAARGEKDGAKHAIVNNPTEAVENPIVFQIS